MKVFTTSHTDVGAKSYQEDRFVVHESNEGCLLAVIDGHGGDQVAQFVADNLLGVFSKNIDESSYTDRLQVTFRMLNKDTRNMHSGSTLSLVFLPSNEEKAYIAVLGDSPVVIREKKGKLFLSPEHNARSNPDERVAAEARGAFYDEGYLYANEMGGGLQMSRAFGDFEFDSFLNRHPQIFTIDLDIKSFVLVASDGLFDPDHEETDVQIKRLTRMIEKNLDAKALVEDALTRETLDNVTAIVAKFE